MRAEQVERLLLGGKTPLGGVRPRYADLGLPNVMASALAARKVPPPSPPIPEKFLDPDLLRSRTVLVLAVDGLGYRQLLTAKKALGGLAILDAAKEDGAFFPVTATLPSTTVAGIGSLCTARSPQSHGLIGYRLFLRAFGAVANMIRFAPIDRSGPPWDPRGFLLGPTAFELAAEKGVPPYVLTRDWFLGSALSTMLHRGAATAGYVAVSDFGVRLREITKVPKKKLVFAYWDAVDTISHRFGTENEEFLAEVATLDSVLERELLRKGRDVTVLLTADHGHINTFARGRLDLRSLPALLDALAVPPTGEPRLTYLHAKDGNAEALRALAADSLGQWARVCTAKEAFAAKLFGEGEPAPEAVERVGDVIAQPVRDRTLIYGYPGEKVDLFGRHGGLTAAEMLVPCLVARR
ncbi:MAG TPA: alkaline phosphatase family protein [Thermoplasmata archaeon]|nr:alkaline phosphatase family protein [Thermoplasmata archaeon]